MKVHDPITPIIKELARINGVKSPEDMKRALNDTKKYVAALRDAYKKKDCIAPYSDAHLRAAYMLAYFPHYIEQIHFLLEELPVQITGQIFRGHNPIVAAFGSGPAPEVLGIVSYAGEHYPNLRKMKVCLLDAHNDVWKTCVDISLDTLAPNYCKGNMVRDCFDCDLSRSCQECATLEWCKKNLPDVSLFVVQNCLNDLQDTNAAIEKVAQIFSFAKPGSLLLILDVAFEHLRDAIKAIEDKVEDRKVGNVVVGVTNYPREHKPNFSYPKIVTDYLLNGKSGLIPKQKTRYYCSAIVRA